MAVLTATKTSYGYRCTGGTTETSISTNSMYVYKFEYIAATNNNAVTIKDKDGNSITKIIGATASTSNERTYGDKENAARFNGLLVTLTQATDELHIYIA
ncbi:MAG: hypothetical protein ABIA66_01220 [Candidatus Omnitrophota bacterium]